MRRGGKRRRHTQCTSTVLCKTGPAPLDPSRTLNIMTQKRLRVLSFDGLFAQHHHKRDPWYSIVRICFPSYTIPPHQARSDLAPITSFRPLAPLLHTYIYLHVRISHGKPFPHPRLAQMPGDFVLADCNTSRLPTEYYCASR